MKHMIGGTQIKNTRITIQACQVIGSMNTSQFLLALGFFMKICTKLWIKVGRKSMTSLRLKDTVKSAAAMSISSLINCPVQEKHRLQWIMSTFCLLLNSELMLLYKKYSNHYQLIRSILQHQSYFPSIPKHDFQILHKKNSEHFSVCPKHRL